MDYKTFMDLLDNQEMLGVSLGDWSKLYYSAVIEEDKIKIRIPNLEVVFIFNKSNGVLVGAYNYKD